MTPDAIEQYQFATDRLIFTVKTNPYSIFNFTNVLLSVSAGHEGPSSGIFLVEYKHYGIMLRPSEGGDIVTHQRVVILIMTKHTTTVTLRQKNIILIRFIFS
jgi:hypothetical protein